MSLLAGCASTGSIGLIESDVVGSHEKTEEVVGYDIYVVQPGDTLSRIAEQFMGDAHKFPELGRANGKDYWLFAPPSGELAKSAHYLVPGQCIKVPPVFVDKKPSIRRGIFEDCDPVCAIDFADGKYAWAEIQTEGAVTRGPFAKGGLFVFANKEENRLYFYGRYNRARSENECK